MTTLLLPPEEIAMLRTMKGLAYLLAVMITLDRHYPGRAFRVDQVALVAGIDARTAARQLQDLSALDRVILTSSGYVLTQGGRAMFLAPEAQDLAQLPKAQAQQALEATENSTHSVCALVVGDSLTTEFKNLTPTPSKSAQTLRTTTAQIIAASPILFGEPGVVRGQLDIENIEPGYALAVIAHCYAMRKTRQNPNGLMKPAGLAYKMLLDGKQPRPEYLDAPASYLAAEYLLKLGIEDVSATQAVSQAEEAPEDAVVVIEPTVIEDIYVLSNGHPAVDAWQAVLGQLALQMHRTVYENWCAGTVAIQYDGSLLTVGACNAVTVDWLDGHVTEITERLLSGILDKPTQVRFVVSEYAEADDDDE